VDGHDFVVRRLDDGGRPPAGALRELAQLLLLRLELFQRLCRLRDVRLAVAGDERSDLGGGLAGCVEDLVRLGADGVGYFLNAGAAVGDNVAGDFGMVRDDADRFGMPLFVWAQAQGRGTEETGGGSLAAVSYATRTARGLGADVVTVRFPDPDPDPGRAGRPAGTGTPQADPQDAIGAVVRSAGEGLVIVSSGPSAGDEVMVTETRLAMRAGAAGIMFDRPLAQRGHRAWMPLIRQLREELGVYCS
jgi:class I fructose-bisphosphate aldolase